MLAHTFWQLMIANKNSALHNIAQSMAPFQITYADAGEGCAGAEYERTMERLMYGVQECFM